MPIYSLRYSFRQKLDAPARKAYKWCTDFEPEDGKLFPVKWIRFVRRLNSDALVLTETTFPQGRTRRIRRLVILNPAELSWTNTHLDGPFQSSQYRYRIVPTNARKCTLEFRGLRLIKSPRRMSRKEIARLAEEERRSDSDLWRRRMAPALRRDLH